tara:strand:+ start:400 stop:645 length:246 start_codon:yes stop_codon:yes gene_type:complete
MNITTNKQANEKAGGKIDDSQFKPPFRTPSAGGSYLKASNDSVDPVLVKRTGHKLDSTEQAALDSVKGAGGKPGKKSNSSE